MEVGPWRVDGNGGFKVVEGGWEEYTTMVYSEYRLFDMCRVSYLILVVDQPAGTGYSYTSTDRFARSLKDVCIFFHLPSRVSSDALPRPPISSLNFYVIFIPCSRNTGQWKWVHLPHHPP